MDGKRLLNFLDGRSIYLSFQNDCFTYQNRIWQLVTSLSCKQEEADQRMLLHANHSRENGTDQVIIHTPDTDVFIFMLHFQEDVGKLYMKIGKGNKKRIININTGERQIKKELSDDVRINKFCAALIGLHAFT